MASRDERLDKIPEMIADGMTYRQIAESLRISMSTVAAAAGAFGTVRSSLIENRRKIAELTATGMSPAEIAKELGYSEGLVVERQKSIKAVVSRAKKERK